MADLIERDAAIKAITGIDAHGNSDRANALGLAEFQLTILPAVDAVPVVHGEWKETWASGLDGVRRWSWCCSECGYEPYYFHDVHTLNYCPNCGAKMEVEHE